MDLRASRCIASLLLIGILIGCSPNLLEAVSYGEYLALYGDEDFSEQDILLDADDLGNHSSDVTRTSEYSGRPCLVTGQTGFVEYEFIVREAGFFNLEIEYHPVPGRGMPMVRSLKIDGEIPYDEVREIRFSRIWADKTPISRDRWGNDLRPDLVEAPEWTTRTIRDEMGYFKEPLKFFLSEGHHSIRLDSISEPLAISTLRFRRCPVIVSYEEAFSRFRASGLEDTSGFICRIQGEKSKNRSDPSIYPLSDRISAATDPNDPSAIRLNTMGGEKWQVAGQWISWEVDVPEKGLYTIGIRARQNAINGAFSMRRLSINGQVPFQEAENIRFSYNSDWDLYVLQDNGQRMRFPLEKGKNEIRMEVTLGSLADLLEEVQRSIGALNEAFRKILMITGPIPDPLRDYQLHRQIPEVITKLGSEAERIGRIRDTYITITGQKGQQAQTLERIYEQVTRMAENPNTIPESFNNFRNQISELGTWLLVSRYQPLEIDYLVIASPDQAMPDARPGLLPQFIFLVRQFISSFLTDYSRIGDPTEGVSRIEVWLNGLTNGRDQAQVLLRMANDTFYKQRNISVDLRLTPIQSLLPALMAKQGPDVILTLSASEPVNYAIRNGVVNLAGFEDFESVSRRFMPSALAPFAFDGGVYALPEAQTFFMLFHRNDILDELGQEVPQTWDDVVSLIPVLQKRNLTFGLPQAMGPYVGIGYYTFAMFLYQNDGELYQVGNARSNLDSLSAIRAFTQWTRFYTDYHLPIQYDFLNRFRSGEIPVGIADYSLFNYLKVFAPDIQGLWGMSPVPGILEADGSLNRSVPGNTTGAVIVRSTPDLEDSWEFLKWWTSTDVQSRFGIELEIILGPSGRYSPANVEALRNIPWTRSELALIEEQLAQVFGVPEVPGSYMTPRLVDFALRDVLNRGLDPDESLKEATDAINNEIRNKYAEFGHGQE